MALLLKYGTYDFPRQTTLSPISRNFQFDGRGVRSRKREVWAVRTIIQAATQPAIKIAVDDLEAALVDGNTLELFQNDGTTTTGHSITDCRILSINYPESTGPEYANRRTVDIGIESITDVSSASPINFQESISYFGGGPVSVMQATITGKPRKFQTAEFSIFRAVQSGSATGRTAYPTPPGPAFSGHGDPNDEPETERNVSYTPEGDQRFNIRWTYRFASSEPFTGDPNTWL